MNDITAAILVIGDEILSGRTLDQNANFIAKRCSDIGIVLDEIRIIPDIQEVIKKVIINASNSHKNVL